MKRSALDLRPSGGDPADDSLYRDLNSVLIQKCAFSEYEENHFRMETKLDCLSHGAASYLATHDASARQLWQHLTMLLQPGSERR